MTRDEHLAQKAAAKAERQQERKAERRRLRAEQACQPDPDAVYAAQPEFNAGRVVIAKLSEGKRQWVSRLTPEQAIVFARALDSAGQRVAARAAKHAEGTTYDGVVGFEVVEDFEMLDFPEIDPEKWFTA